MAIETSMFPTTLTKRTAAVNENVVNAICLVHWVGAHSDFHRKEKWLDTVIEEGEEQEQQNSKIPGNVSIE